MMSLSVKGRAYSRFKVGVQAPEIIFGLFCPKSGGLTLVLSLSEPIIGGALALEVTTSLL